MSEADETPTVTEWIELHRLEPPETDVRSNRDREELRSLGQSLERSGQLQAAKVYPVIDGEAYLDADAGQDALTDALTDADDFRVVDGWSRREAARIANWDRLRCEVFPEPPEDQILASLDANTERLDMDDYETIKALADLKEQQGLTQEELAQKIGRARSTVSNYFRALDGYEPAVTAWKDPDSHISYGHVREIEQLPNEELKERVLTDALEFDRSVSMLRQTAKNTLEGWKRNQADQRTKEEREDDGHTERARREEARTREANENAMQCFFCGDPTERQVAVPVCEEDSGMVYRKKESGDPLLASLQPEEEAQSEAD